MWSKNVFLTHPLQRVVETMPWLWLFPFCLSSAAAFFSSFFFCLFVYLLEHFDGKFEELYWDISSLASKLFSLWPIVTNGHTHVNKTRVSCCLLSTVNSDPPLIFSMLLCIFSFLKRCWSQLRSFEHTDVVMNWSWENTDLVCCCSV